MSTRIDNNKPINTQSKVTGPKPEEGVTDLDELKTGDAPERQLGGGDPGVDAETVAGLARAQQPQPMVGRNADPLATARGERAAAYTARAFELSGAAQEIEANGLPETAAYVEQLGMSFEHAGDLAEANAPLVHGETYARRTEARFMNLTRVLREVGSIKALPGVSSPTEIFDAGVALAMDGPRAVAQRLLEDQIEPMANRLASSVRGSLLVLQPKKQLAQMKPGEKIRLEAEIEGNATEVVTVKSGRALEVEARVDGTFVIKSEVGLGLGAGVGGTGVGVGGVNEEVFIAQNLDQAAELLGLVRDDLSLTAMTSALLGKEMPPPPDEDTLGLQLGGEIDIPGRGKEELVFHGYRRREIDAKGTVRDIGGLELDLTLSVKAGIDAGAVEISQSFRLASVTLRHERELGGSVMASESASLEVVLGQEIEERKLEVKIARKDGQIDTQALGRTLASSLGEGIEGALKRLKEEGYEVELSYERSEIEDARFKVGIEGAASVKGGAVTTRPLPFDEEGGARTFLGRR